MIELGVTLDAIAYLRESRKAKRPDPVFAALIAEQAGASAINVQLRGDRTHIQERDVEQLRATVTAELNLVITPRQEMAHVALTAKPDRVTFIPERLESAGGGGLDVLLNSSQLKERINEAERNAATLIARRNAAVAQKKVAMALADVGNADDAFATLGRLEQAVEREEAAAIAFDSLAAGSDDDDLEKQFAALELTGGGMDDDLAALKAELGD